MRWSLILSTFVLAQSTLSVVCVALAIPPSLNDLEARARSGAKISSQAYRKNSRGHPYSYTFHDNGDVTRERLKNNERLKYGEKMLKFPKVDADHIFEHQMLTNQLRKHKLDFGRLPANLQDKVVKIMNGPGNMAAIPAHINRGKGQLIKYGMRGKSISQKNGRDDYALVSYTTARKTAIKLDKAFKHYGFKETNFHASLRKTMNDAKILKPGQPSPRGSSKESHPGSSTGSSHTGSSQASPARSAGASSPRVSNTGSASGVQPGNLVTLQ